MVIVVIPASADIAERDYPVIAAPASAVTAAPASAVTAAPASAVTAAPA